MVTTRPWKAKQLLVMGYELMTINQNMSKGDRNRFIEDFFKNMVRKQGAGGVELIEALESDRNIVPLDMQQNKRMLLYICHAWKYFKVVNALFSFKSDDSNSSIHYFKAQKDTDSFFDKTKMLDRLWEQMRYTFNTKYPNPEVFISEEKLRDIRVAIQ